MIQETTRAVKELGMAGVALFVGPTAKPPDMACFEGLYRTCEELGAAVWVHPCRPQSYADYDAYKVDAHFLNWPGRNLSRTAVVAFVPGFAEQPDCCRRLW